MCSLHNKVGPPILGIPRNVSHSLANAEARNSGPSWEKTGIKLPTAKWNFPSNLGKMLPRQHSHWAAPKKIGLGL